jgi:hypothetical protein
MVFWSYVRETVNRHRQFKMAPELWTAFWTVWTGFLATKTKLTEAQKDAWMELGKEFAIAANSHLEMLKLPHVAELALSVQ